jgi:1-acyl-sn-glycerol-3-phosphate acyltransferase
VGYRLLRRFARLLLALFYRRVEVVGAERIPATGPLIVAANHQNALVDPMMLLGTVPRRLRPIAKAPLFRHPLVGPFLRLTGALPVHRRQDPGSDPARNEAIFREAAGTLATGGAILIFPEGVSQAEPTLMPLRTGAARLALAAESASGGRLGLTLLPVGLVYHEPGRFRTGWSLTLIGEPLPLADAVALYRTAPEAAVRRVTDRLAEALGQLIVEARDRKLLRLAEVAEAIWRAESSGPGDVAARAEWVKMAIRGYRYLLTREPARIEALMRATERYAKDLELAGLTDRQLAQTYPAAVVWRYAWREGLSLLGGLPLGLWGVLSHALPYQLTRAAVRLARPDPDVEATYKIVAGVVLYPLGWLLEGWIAWRLGGGWLLALFSLALLPAGFLALTWWERLSRVGREVRGFFRFLVDRDFQRRLLARRHALMEELTALARQVPGRVLVGGSSSEGQ